VNTQQSVVERIVSVHPDLRELLTRHVEESEGLIPYVFMGEVVQWVTLRHASGFDPDVATLIKLLEQLYEEGPDDVRDYIATGFVEDMLQPGVADLFGPFLSDARRRAGTLPD
jgi:hypothetical protein